MDDLNSYLRSLVVGLKEKVPLINGEYVTAINFDNAATTPPLKSVLEEVVNFIPWYSSVHRGTGYKSILSSDLYEEGRTVIKEFVNADKTGDTVIYTKNATESINLLAYMLAQDNDGNEVVLTTLMEHLANDLPWRDKFQVDYIGIDSCGGLLLEDLEMKLRKYRGRVKLVTVTGASNVTGYKNPIDKIAGLTHKYGAKLLVDGAQLVPHCPIDMKGYDSPEHIDYLVFSAHKMYAPFGLGVLIGPKEIFERYQPVYRGGGAVKLVSQRFIKWDSAPYKYETGTPNVIGVVALVAAIRALTAIGMESVYNCEKELIEYAAEGLASIPGMRLYGAESDERIGIVSFSIEGVYHRLLAKALAGEAGIAVRSGLFCAHPYVERLMGITDEELEFYKENPGVPLPGLIRVSLGLYNSFQEIDDLIDSLGWIVRNKATCLEEYQRIIDAVPGTSWRYKVRRETP
ncbi:MAG: Cysteine desulfurase [Firmicutes bacterium]|nr:Cysteine desulfurase [Bacillota bacterium]